MAGQGLISREGAVLVIIDLQEKLLPHISEEEELVENIAKLVLFAEIMKIPIALTEQYPKGLGHTIPKTKTLVPAVQPIERMEFRCFGSEKFREALSKLEARTLVITGTESHICITQTAMEGLGGGYRCCLVSDAVSSRKPGDKAISLERMKQSGVTIVSTEMLIYELLRKAGTPEFKEALKLVKM